jgi:hypothetical protein
VTSHACDVLIVGGGLGGVAAALAACRGGHRVCITEPTRWLGGQATSQGVSILDEHDHIETFGGTATYYQWREGIRDYYPDRYALSPVAMAADYFNPGAGADTCRFEPRVGLIALLEMLREPVAQERLEIFYDAHPVDVEIAEGNISRVHLCQPSHDRMLQIEAAYVLDATELGDLLPLAGAPWRSGAESVEQTQEPHARADGPAPQLVQRFSIPFVVGLSKSGENHTIPCPECYQANRGRQPYTTGAADGTGFLDSVWSQWRVLAAHQFMPEQIHQDLAVIICPGTDFAGGNLIEADDTRRQQLVNEAKQLSLGYLYWLQTEAPRDDGAGVGYPELRLLSEAMGTHDGLAMAPYIRESRRIVGRAIVREQDVSIESQTGVRAAFCDDSVGIGWSPLAIHPAPGDIDLRRKTRPFQIPLGALLPADGPGNLLASCKNIGTTHLTTSCYRSHPVEWNIGEAAGALVSYCLHQAVTPAAVHSTARHLRAFQAGLPEQGVPLGWFTDIPLSHPGFAAVQKLAARGVTMSSTDDLLFRPNEAISPDLVQQLVDGGVESETLASKTSRGEAAIAAAGQFGA